MWGGVTTDCRVPTGVDGCWQPNLLLVRGLYWRAHIVRELQQVQQQLLQVCRLSVLNGLQVHRVTRSDLPRQRLHRPVRVEQPDQLRGWICHLFRAWLHGTRARSGYIAGG